MIAYWDTGCEWMGEGLQLAICPSFTGPTGLSALDVSGRGNSGNLTNMDRNTAWVTSGGKGALSLDGSNDYVDLATSGRQYPNLTQATWNFWVNFENFSKTYNQIAETKPTLLSGSINYQMSCLVKSNGKLAFYVFGVSSENQSNYDGSGTFTLSANQWHMLTYAFQGGQRQEGFVDGRLDGAAANPVPSMTSSPENVRLGFSIFGDRYPAMQLDDIRIYNRALTAPEIRQLYERDRGGGMLHQPPSRRSYYAQLAAAFLIVAGSGSYALSGQPIPLLYGRALSAGSGSVLLSGQATPLLTSRLLSADQGSYAYSGTDAATLLGRLLDAEAAAYTLDGNAAGFLASRRISADTVAYLASGLDVGFLRTRVLEAGTGQYVLVASPVNITTGAPGTGGAAPYYYLFLLGGSR